MYFLVPSAAEGQASWLWLFPTAYCADFSCVLACRAVSKEKKAFLSLLHTQQHGHLRPSILLCWSKVIGSTNMDLQLIGFHYGGCFRGMMQFLFLLTALLPSRSL